MSFSIDSIPKELIYEMVEDQPIFYKGTKDFLAGEIKKSDLRGSSYLQSLLITRLVFFLMTSLGKEYTVLTNEIGLQIKPGNWRAADIAVMAPASLSNIPLDNKYLSIPPKLVIEIDTKAELPGSNLEQDYFHQKTDELLDFGVEQVVWIFTNSQKVMLAQADQAWEINGWDKEILLLNAIPLSILELLPENLDYQ